MIPLIILFTVIGVFLGLIVSTRPEFPDCSHWDYEIKATRLSMLENDISVLKRENERLNYILKNNGYRTFPCCMSQNGLHYGYSCDCHLKRKIYAKTPEEQEVADMLKKITLTSEEIAEKLGMKITK